MVQILLEIKQLLHFLFTRVRNLKNNVASFKFKITIKGVTVSPVFPRSKQDIFPALTHYLVCVEPKVYTLL